MEQVVNDSRDACAESFVLSMVHTDFKEGNPVAEQRNGAWRISGIFDLADMHVGDGEYDLALPL